MPGTWARAARVLLPALLVGAPAAPVHSAPASKPEVEPSKTRNAVIAKRVLLTKGWLLRLCFQPLSRRKDTFCMAVGALAQRYPEHAPAIGELVLHMGNEFALTAKRDLQAHTVVASFLAQPRLIGCAGSGWTRGGVFLAMESLTGTKGWTNRGYGMDTRLRKRCKRLGHDATGPSAEPLLSAMGEAYTQNLAVEAFLTDVMKLERSCISADAAVAGAGAQDGTAAARGENAWGVVAEGKKDAIGRRALVVRHERSGEVGLVMPAPDEPFETLHASLLSGLGGTASSTQMRRWIDSPAVVGGSCFDGECEATCVANAHAKALAKMLAREGYEGCRNRQPKSDGVTNACSKAVRWKRDSIDAEIRQRLWNEGCAHHGGTVSDGKCQLPIPPLTVSATCKDARSMCGPGTLMKSLTFPLPKATVAAPEPAASVATTTAAPD